MNKYIPWERYKGVIKKDNEIVEEDFFLTYDDEHDKFLSHFRRDGKPLVSSFGASLSLSMNRDVLPKEEIDRLEKIIEEEALPYGTNLEGYYVDEDTIELYTNDIKKGRRR